MGVDVNRFNKSSAKGQYSGEDARAILDFEKRILYVGKLIYYKGIEYLLMAFSRLKDMRTCLIIVGDGEARGMLLRLADALGISKRVVFLGWIPDAALLSVYSLVDVVVLPSVSRREAFGIVLLEAMASGKPVVATSIPGVCDVVDHGKTGYLVPPRDPIAMAKAIEHILKDAATAKRMGDEGRAIATRRYDWKIICDSYQKISHSFCNGRRFQTWCSEFWNISPLSS
jgi:glycosyltransferase involved in cell wall biosynthesis